MTEHALPPVRRPVLNVSENLCPFSHSLLKGERHAAQIFIGHAETLEAAPTEGDVQRAHEALVALTLDKVRRSHEANLRPRIPQVDDPLPESLRIVDRQKVVFRVTPGRAAEYVRLNIPLIDDRRIGSGALRRNARDDRRPRKLRALEERGRCGPAPRDEGADCLPQCIDPFDARHRQGGIGVVEGPRLHLMTFDIVPKAVEIMGPWVAFAIFPDGIDVARELKGKAAEVMFHVAVEVRREQEIGRALPPIYNHPAREMDLAQQADWRLDPLAFPCLEALQHRLQSVPVGPILAIDTPDLDRSDDRRFTGDADAL